MTDETDLTSCESINKAIVRAKRLLEETDDPGPTGADSIAILWWAKRPDEWEVHATCYSARQTSRQHTCSTPTEAATFAEALTVDYDTENP